MPPRVFIGSSSESLDLAKAIQHNLGNTADCVIWKQNFFKPSTYPLEQLETEVGNFDFGIFVFSPDDLVRIRNKHFFAVRDNVIFELGLFIGRIGRRRNFIVVPKDTPKLRLPSDLLGLKNVSYDPHRSDENWVAAIGTACYLIETTIKELGYLREPYIHTPAKAAKAVQKYKSDLIKPYLGWGFGDSLEIQPSPDLQEGWLLSQVEIHHNETDPFILPPEHEQAYKEYFEKNFIRKRFADDGEKFMLALNPTSFEEAPTLRLQTRLTKYSMQHFYRDVISKRTFESGRLIHDLIRGSLRVGFPHALNLQMVIATKDDKLLLTQRSPKVSSYAYTWSCSVEEDLKRSDLQEGPKRATEAWCRRLLREELLLDPTTYDVDSVRVLSVFLEGDALNISLCAYAKIRPTFDELDAVLKVKRGDLEFVDWKPLECTRVALLREIFQPSEEYHPSSRYRMFMAFLKMYGYPMETEIPVK